MNQKKQYQNEEKIVFIYHFPKKKKEKEKKKKNYKILFNIDWTQNLIVIYLGLTKIILKKVF